MNALLQTITALIIVAIACALLLRSALKKRKSPGCGGECGCPTNDFKVKLKEVRRDAKVTSDEFKPPEKFAGYRRHFSMLLKKR